MVRPYRRPTELLEIARLTDKYDLKGVMRTHAECWISEYLAFIEEGGACDEPREKLLVVAYYFGLPETFSRIGKDVLLKQLGDFRGFDGSSTLFNFEEPFAQVFDAIDLQRKKIKLDIVSVLNQIFEAELTTSTARCSHKACDYAEKRLYLLMTTLRAKKLWPISCKYFDSIEVLWRRMETVELASMTFPSKCDARRGCAGDGFPHLRDIRTGLSKYVRDARMEIKVPCCYCVLESKPLQAKCPHGF